ncbi:MAG TPA: N-formylglutamate amidohydrolase [Aliidongia sp.]|uniref:N-formylglutamate amidohydrolase n=1 Tax=Aliidongia sp. TaxID=1914230 RepID=UPI002DDDAEE0|nr:N-formylglutamate amidohydrolase [Aliidongia sp.]HEV2675958.1 N-formylglutamate amidohydrolase [Aliidongia sp.]
MAPQAGCATLLQAGDPPPFTVLNPLGRAKVLLICDHASRAVPKALNSLGLNEADLAKHVGWDIGAAALTQELSRRWDAPAILSSYSRLVVDCNRVLGEPTSMPAVSDGIAVPANQNMTDEQAAARAAECYWPYHAAVTAALDRFAAAGVAPAVISMHSFTPRMNEADRPWHVGVLWDQDPRLPVPLIANLARLHGLTVGDNEPYSARDPHGFTLRHHVMPRGLPNVLLEMRQDEVATDEGVLRYADFLETAFAPILADPALYRPAMYL